MILHYGESIIQASVLVLFFFFFLRVGEEGRDGRGREGGRESKLCVRVRL